MFIQRSAPRVDSHEWHEMWQKMDQFLVKFSASMVWKFIPEQLQDPVKVTEYLQGEYCGNFREGQLTAACWALATLYWTQFNTRQHPQGKRRKTDLQALWPDLQLNQRNNLCQQ